MDGSFGSGWTRVTGPLAAGPFAFTGPLHGGRLRFFSFENVTATGAVFELEDLKLQVEDSRFEECVFRQPKAHAKDRGEPQGTFGRRPSTYVRCRFVGVRFRLRAGFSVGQARFERCLFENCRFEEHFSFAADYVSCVFEGPIQTAVFYGVVPPGQPAAGKRNEIAGNDFSRAKLSDNIGWRGGVDLSAQKWPQGYVPRARE